MTTADKTVARLLRRWRTLMAYSTAQAGAVFRLSARTIEDIEQGRRRAGDQLTAIALQSLIDKKTHDQVGIGND